ncbi:MAG TPA: DUF4162 domain-containing protein, partial [Patescibacteria group bacterium]|nr:DUF4162 domain-containing protein [Patescibacteria group bacterium]
ILQEVQSACDRAIIIHQGKIVAQGTINELVHNSKGQSQVRVIIESQQESIVEELKSLEGVKEVSYLKNHEYVLTSASHEDIRRSIFQLCVTKGWVLLEMERSAQSLEDVFRQLTTQS